MNTGLMTVAQTADYMKLSEKTIRRLIKHGQLPASRVGDRSLRIRLNDVERLISDTSTAHRNQIRIDGKDDVPPNVVPLAKPVLADVLSAVANGPRMVSMFTGCGGLDLGFSEAGFHIIWGNDFDADAQAVHALNLGPVDGRNIMDVNEDEIPDCDILTAGFPCQPFSNAGNRRGVHDSRGMLYKECLRIIARKMPKAIVFENVKGLLSTNYIDGRNLAEVIVEDLSSMNGIGYNVTYQLVNAADYDVPQNRQRVLFVGVRKDLGVTFVFPEKHSRDGLTLRNVLTVPEGAQAHVAWPFSPQALDMVSYIPEGGSWKDVPYDHLAPRFQRIRDDMKKYHSPNFYRRFSRDEICGTMTASAQPENCGIIHPTEDRRFTVREVARIQTFPDKFQFITDTPKDITAMYKVIGNAVPVNLARNIAQAIMEQVFAPAEGGNGHDRH